MYNFLNDYSDTAHPKILEALVSIGDETNVGYGFDTYSNEARDLIKDLVKDQDLDIHFLAGGTIANIIGTTMGLRAQESIIAPSTGHIIGHEAGAIEATGHKIETIETANGKLSSGLIEKKLEDFGPEFTTLPRTVYISNTTELGTVYSKDEIKAIYDFCKDHGLYLFIDGARLGHGLVSHKAGGLSFEDLPKLCDAFTIGGTKNGLVFGDALLVKNPYLKDGLIHLIKQKGALMAKGFVLGIQFKAMFEDKNFYLNLARQAYKCAQILGQGLADKGYLLQSPVESNQVFIKASLDDFDHLSKFGKIDILGKEDGMEIVRFVTSYRTEEKQVQEFLSLI